MRDVICFLCGVAIGTLILILTMQHPLWVVHDGERPFISITREAAEAEARRRGDRDEKAGVQSRWFVEEVP